MNTKQIIGLILSLFGGGLLFWFLIEVTKNDFGIGVFEMVIGVIPLIALIAGIILIILGGKEKDK